MGKLSGNWITGAHSGRACRHENIYTKVNKKTGACYSAKLCNPVSVWTEKQLAQRASFGAISSAISAWIRKERESASADYVKVYRIYDRQTTYGTLRGMMYAKGMYRINEDGSVEVDIRNGTTGNIAAPPASGGSSGEGSGGGTGSGGGEDNIVE